MLSCERGHHFGARQLPTQRWHTRGAWAAPLSWLPQRTPGGMRRWDDSCHAGTGVPGRRGLVRQEAQRG